MRSGVRSPSAPLKPAPVLAIHAITAGAQGQKQHERYSCRQGWTLPSPAAIGVATTHGQMTRERWRPFFVEIILRRDAADIAVRAISGLGRSHRSEIRADRATRRATAAIS